jgi:hypothetical protein
MFQNLSTSAVLRDFSEFDPGELDTDVPDVAVKPGNQRTGGFVFYFGVRNYVAGDVYAFLEGSIDNGETYFKLPFRQGDQSKDAQQPPNGASVKLDADGSRPLVPVGPVPEVLRLVLHPSAGFDGEVKTQCYSAGRILGIGQDL